MTGMSIFYDEETVLSVNDIKEAAESGAEEITESLNMVQQFLKDLPEKAFRFGARLLFAIILLFVASKLIKLIRRLVRKSLIKAKTDVSIQSFVDSLIKVLLYALVIIYLATYFGVESASLVALLGSAGVAIALALQGSLSNLTGGILLLLLKPFKLGDYIKEDGKGNEGTVTEIGLFYTKLLTIDEKTVILPNGQLANTSLTNNTASATRTLVQFFDISYDADIKKAKQLIKEILEADERVQSIRPMKIYVESLDSSSVRIGVRAQVKSGELFEFKWDFIEKVKASFDENGIEIPFNQLDVHIKDEPGSADDKKD